MSNAPACRTCRHFRPQALAAETPTPGACLWAPPPYLQRMVAMLHAEPATHIDWNGTNAEPPEVHAEYSCSAYARAAVLTVLS